MLFSYQDNNETQKAVRKRKAAPETWKRESKKRLRNSKEIRLTITEPKKSCDHSTPFCQAAQLTEEDIRGTFSYYRKGIRQRHILHSFHHSVYSFLRYRIRRTECRKSEYNFDELHDCLRTRSPNQY